ncbi:acetamidase/formamidase family protein [Spiribacter halobius]|uniref:Formamidase n=1 Tax=Sediminicurvatus halobius TaxID=2182432 RepID=A0A2U2N157_9GAMM|nr:acetamidase/formamidase family protein [Spiribacter halobius]PWG62926.1 formamidase [Spiribacter halobius]UEX77437.1 acetamidase/formamidase family protein [Spiribacter halobius]
MVRSIFVAAACGLLALPALADTTDVTWQSRVLVEKQGEHCADDPHCFNRYHPAIEPVARAAPGDYVVFETRDALDTDLTLDSNADDLAALDLNLVHPMTGPVHIEGARQGDVLAVTLVDIEPDQYGYTVIVPGFGFLRDRFTEPFLVNWKLDGNAATSDQMPGVRVPMAAFMGSVGVLPGEAEVRAWREREAALADAGGVALAPQPIGAIPADVCGPDAPHADACLRTIPPRENGGNMDVQQMQVGTTLLLPCFIDGCGLFVGDVHYAQGDGEVSGTAIEMGARVTVRTEILRGRAAETPAPQFHGDDQLKTIAPADFYATVGYPLKESGTVPPSHEYLSGTVIPDLQNLNEDLTLAARNALLDMIDYIVREHGLSAEQAYILSSVAVDLVIGQVVDVPNYTVSAVLDLGVFEDR